MSRPLSAPTATAVRFVISIPTNRTRPKPGAKSFGEVSETCQNCHYPHNPYHPQEEAGAELPVCADCHGSHQIDYVEDILNQYASGLRCLPYRPDG